MRSKDWGINILIGLMGAILIILGMVIGFIVGITETTKIFETEFYPQIGVVYGIDTESDIVTIRTPAEFLYQFHGCDGWEMWDSCTMIMDGKNTELLSDDEIVMVCHERGLE